MPNFAGWNVGCTCCKGVDNISCATCNLGFSLGKRSLTYPDDHSCNLVHRILVDERHDNSLDDCTSHFAVHRVNPRSHHLETNADHFREHLLLRLDVHSAGGAVRVHGDHVLANHAMQHLQERLQAGRVQVRRLDVADSLQQRDAHDDGLRTTDGSEI